MSSKRLVFNMKAEVLSYMYFTVNVKCVAQISNVLFFIRKSEALISYLKLREKSKFKNQSI